MLDPNFFRELRTRLKMSQGAVGKKIGTSGQYISNLERGVMSISSTQIKKIAKVYQISPRKIANYIAEYRRLKLLREVSE